MVESFSKMSMQMKYPQPSPHKKMWKYHDCVIQDKPVRIVKASVFDHYDVKAKCLWKKDILQTMIICTINQWLVGIEQCFF